MLRCHPVFNSWGGFGDLLVWIPYLERFKTQCILGHDPKLRIGVVKDLVKTLAPNVNLYPKNTKKEYISFKKDFTPIEKPKRVSEVISNFLNVEPVYTCTDKAISRISSLTGLGDYIVVHRFPYQAPTREWDGWDKLDIPSFPHFSVGCDSDPHPPTWQRFSGDFLETAKLLRGSKGLVCINSSMMNLANLLGTRTICIQMNDFFAKAFPSIGMNLMNPDYRLVKFLIKKMLRD